MKAIYKDKVYHLNHDIPETMTPVDGGDPIEVPYGSDELIVDPTDGQLDDVGYFPKEVRDALPISMEEIERREKLLMPDAADEKPERELEWPALDYPAIFAICASLRDKARRAKYCESELSDSDGAVGFMAEAGRLAVEFTVWADDHVDFEKWDECWPYYLDAHFGKVIFCKWGLARLDRIKAADFPQLAADLKLPLK